MSEREIRQFPDLDGLAAGAADDIVSVVVAAQRDRGSASLVLTGGGSGIAVLSALRERSAEIDWSAVDIFFGDERFLPEGDAERNSVQAREALLDHVAVDDARVHVMAASDGPLGDDPEAGAVAYHQALAAFGGVDGPTFDVHLLGMGPDTHINSLFAGSDAVKEESRLVVAVTASPKPPPRRITLTLPAVRRARHAWFLVAGKGKAGAVKTVFDGADAVDAPAAGGIGLESTVFYLDDAAASEL